MAGQSIIQEPRTAGPLSSGNECSVVGRLSGSVKVDALQGILDAIYGNLLGTLHVVFSSELGSLGVQREEEGRLFGILEVDLLVSHNVIFSLVKAAVTLLDHLIQLQL